MSTTVEELIEFLEQFPKDTRVEVIQGHPGSDYSGDTFSVRDFEIPKNETLNERFMWYDESFEYYKPIEGTGTLLLGRN